MIECHSIEDSRERVDCYDGIAEAAAASTMHKPRDSTPRREETDRRIEEPAAAADSSAAAPVSGEALSRHGQKNAAVGTFGADKLRHDKDERLDRIVAEITRVRRLSRGNFLLTLDNGQTWREIEYDKYTRYAVGDSVEISRGRLGTYDLVSQATGHRNKVRRVE